ncbi:MAG: peroxiredoxin [Pyrinomonadaceae bacterium]|nr:peroxiredoxin [Phycisphaerales bacterium]
MSPTDQNTGAELNQPAPGFSLPDSSGNLVTLASYQGKHIVVVYFYPKAGSAGCTAEACKFRDEYESFSDLGAEVIGISSDAAHQLQKFAASNRLPFRLLSDAGGKVRKAWGVPKDLLFLPGRVTYVIDRAGIVRHIFRSATNMTKHMTEAARVVKQLSENEYA